MGDLAILLTVSNTSSQPSWNPLEDLAMLLHYDFMVHAFEAGTIVAIVAGAIGYFVVLRGSAFAAHALSHIGFAGATGAVVLSLNPIFGLLAFTLGSGVAIGALGNRLRGRDEVAATQWRQAMLAEVIGRFADWAVDPRRLGRVPRFRGDRSPEGRQGRDLVPRFVEGGPNELGHPDVEHDMAAVPLPHVQHAADEVPLRE